MTILAQQFLDTMGTRRSNIFDTPHDSTLVAALSLPEEPDGLKEFSSRIVYDIDLLQFVRDLKDDGLDQTMVEKTIMLPNRLTWIESRWEYDLNGASLRADTERRPGFQYDPRMRAGILLKRPDEPLLFAEVFLVMGSSVSEAPPVVWGHGFVTRGEKIQIALDVTPGASDPRTDHHFPDMVLNLLYGLFFLQHPKTIHIERSLPVGPKLQKARKKSSKAPLITYRRIHLLVGQKTARHYPNCQKGFGEEHYGKKRYHRVEGHWRRLHWDDPERQAVVFVQEHYRGDVALGMSLTERHVYGRAA